MTTVSEMLDNLPFVGVSAMLVQVKGRLGDDFEYEIDKENNKVLISKVPENYKENIFDSISQIGFVPTAI
jgi:hypothetical protein